LLKTNNWNALSSNGNWNENTFLKFQFSEVFDKWKKPVSNKQKQFCFEKTIIQILNWKCTEGCLVGVFIILKFSNLNFVI
jgi:hypothetical protein